MCAYSTRFDDALTLVSDLHRDQTRKGTGVPYITHLMGVAAIVGDVGGSEDQVIAALLHDTIEDQVEHHPDIKATIGERFGADVLKIVLACSDAVVHPKPPWKARKMSYIQHLVEANDSDPALLVSLADKTYNGLTLLRDARIHGAPLWSRFKATPAQTQWYYTAIADAFEQKQWPNAEQRALAADYRRLVNALGVVISGFDAE
jgi:(p)ppGpp synthase/HD superfamily hydrolase